MENLRISLTFFSWTVWPLYCSYPFTTQDGAVKETNHTFELGPLSVSFDTHDAPEA